MSTTLKRPARIGLITDQTGPLSFMGIANVNVANMVIDDINARGGVLGRPVELFIEDSATDDSVAEAAAAKLVDRAVDVVGRHVQDVAVGGVGRPAQGHREPPLGLAAAPLRRPVREPADGVRVEVTLPDGADPFVALFSESTGRVLVSLPASRSDELLELAAGADVPVRRLGVTGSDALDVEGQFTLALDEIRTTWQAPIPVAMAAGGH